MSLRALKTDEEIAGIPLDQEILIELPGGDIPLDDVRETKKPEPDSDAKTLQDQLEALKAAQAADRERADRLEREAADAKRLANQRAQEVEEAHKRATALESDVISGGLQAAQSERDSAKQALQQAGEAGDWKAIADAQSRIGRAEAKILAYESGAAEVAERKETRTEVRQEAHTPSWHEQVRANAALMSTERDWMLRNEAAFKDMDFNKKLESAYQGAIQKGLVRGSQDYFDHIERATGLKATNEDREVSMQAPVTRSETTVDGRSDSGKIKLSAEEREICKSMGTSEIEYARNKAKMLAAMKADPERFGQRG